MRKILGVVLASLTVALVLASSVDAGAKDGKIRWSAKKTGACKWFDAIKVPAMEGNKPGKVELKIVFKAKELAEFFVIGDGDTDLDLFILDAKGGLVAKDEDPAERGSDLCVCRWTPDTEQEYTIVITNLGKVYNVAQAGCN